MDVTVTPI